MIGLALALALGLPSPQASPPPPPQDPTAVTLDDVVVDARGIELMAQAFIEDVAAPNRRRGLARWNTPLCVGVANLQRDVAQAIIDRVSDVAGDLDVRVGEPGCKANALIVATDDGAGMARSLVQARRRSFDVGSLQMMQTSSALEAFQSDDRPVRWWQISMPVNSVNGERAIRLPGESPPVIFVFAASRLVSQIRDDMNKVIIIVDMDDVSGLPVNKLADYMAMVTLAQIDDDAESARYDTVLNLFDTPERVDGLTDWDMAYLRGLYSAEQNRINLNAQARNVADAVVRARREAAAPTEE
ncbi:MAG TPA: hypothetical protein VGB60_06950 [Brevundimonas sp.]|jgi:hypothetical protein|uniref:hypothetical protein n=1 Tax=Brevundimonas sp. TaxID=1871086 RepID=UPI002EDB0558